MTPNMTLFLTALLLLGGLFALAMFAHIVPQIAPALDALAGG